MITTMSKNKLMYRISNIGTPNAQILAIFCFGKSFGEYFSILCNNYSTQNFFSNQLHFLGSLPSRIVETHAVVAVVSFLLPHDQHFMFSLIVSRWLLYY